MTDSDYERLRTCLHPPWWSWARPCGVPWWRPIRFFRSIRSTRLAIAATLHQRHDQDRESLVPRAEFHPVRCNIVVIHTWGPPWRKP